MQPLRIQRAKMLASIFMGVISHLTVVETSPAIRIFFCCPPSETLRKSYLHVHVDMFQGNPPFFIALVAPQERGTLLYLRALDSFE
jgi:hypothetical protein